jgi:hypothetical protein
MLHLKLLLQESRLWHRMATNEWSFNDESPPVVIKFTRDAISPCHFRVFWKIPVSFFSSLQAERERERAIIKQRFNEILY